MSTLGGALSAGAFWMPDFCVISWPRHSPRPPASAFRSMAGGRVMYRLPRFELGVWGGRGEGGGRGREGGADDRAVYVDGRCAVGGGLAGGGVDPGEQVGPLVGQVEHDVLV